MRVNRKYSIAVALLAILATVFGLAGTVTPVSDLVSPQQSSSSDSVTHFMYPPTYDSGWVNITDECGESITLTHDLIDIARARLVVRERRTVLQRVVGK